MYLELPPARADTHAAAASSAASPKIMIMILPAVRQTAQECFSKRYI